MKNIALITAKGNNQSLKNKNLIEIEGKSFLGWQISAAKLASSIDEVFISSECPAILEEAQKYGINIIKRPEYLARADTNHGDVIIHGVQEVRKIIADIGIVVILLGNTISVRPYDIDKVVSALNDDRDATSCMTVWKAQDDHPYRAMRINDDSYLESFMDNKSIDTNRQSYPDIFFYDQGPWAVKYSTLVNAQAERSGPSCWWWMGDKCIPIIRNWVTGRDIHDKLDVEMSRLYLKEQLWDL
ncbi:MAG: hypothetical protein HDT39_16640 [Lachnospiraceae bacterium]|nr:hypothetical protein [Lachnospiraceae bacterium]